MNSMLIPNLVSSYPVYPVQDEQSYRPKVYESSTCVSPIPLALGLMF